MNEDYNRKEIQDKKGLADTYTCLNTIIYTVGHKKKNNLFFPVTSSKINRF